MSRRTRAAFIAVVGIALGALAADTTPAAHAGLDDFRFESFEADYHLDRDGEGRSVLTTVETIVAVFPDFNQNRGFIRDIPTRYQGVPTDIELVSVTDGDGNPRPWHEATEDEQSGEEGFYELVLAGTEFVQGRQSYIVTYTQRNVTRFFGNTGVEEFYWDVNGTGWRQPFGAVVGRLHLPPELASAFTGAVQCYQGRFGSTDRCETTILDQADGGSIIQVGAEGLLAYENVTMAVAFAPGTFVPRDPAYLLSPFAPLQLLSVLLSMFALGWVVVRRTTILRDAPGRPTIIAEYAPPKSRTVVKAALTLGRVRRATAAQFIDLAVRRNIRLLDSVKSSWFAEKSTYTLELLTEEEANGQERNFMRIFFGRALVPGSQYRVSKSDTSRSQAVYRFVQSSKRSAARGDLRAEISPWTRVAPILASTIALVGTVIFGYLVWDDARGGALPFVFVAFAVAVELVTIAIMQREPLTAVGAEFRDHLKGLRVYIELAEADRLRVLQSPVGALRVPVSADDPSQVVKLYERLLPYAVLFGLEKQWAQELGRYYEDSPPDWYAGSSGFNSARFASSIGAMSATTSSTFTGSSSSSSSGGSGGGGSSGGGGGGGGGRGV